VLLSVRTNVQIYPFLAQKSEIPRLSDCSVLPIFCPSNVMFSYIWIKNIIQFFVKFIYNF
jgi:hypothetical protein